MFVVHRVMMLQFNEKCMNVITKGMFGYTFESLGEDLKTFFFAVENHPPFPFFPISGKTL